MNQLAVSAEFLLVLACGAPTPSNTQQLMPITGELEGRTPVCGAVPILDCYGVAALFVNNLARSQVSVLQESGGVVSVEPRSTCPPVPDWADPGFYWQASATTVDGRVCMVVARQTVPAMGLGFGQVGGDDMAGMAHLPGRPSAQPCVQLQPISMTSI